MKTGVLMIGALSVVFALTGCGQAGHRLAMAVEAARYASKHSGEYRVYSIPAASMLPTLRIGDTILVDRSAYRHASPQRGDIIMFEPPVPSEADFIKRIVALPGDTFRISHGTVYVNGARVREPYVHEPAQYDMAIHNYGIYVAESGTGPEPLDRTEARIPARSMWSASDRVPDGCYIVLGDNRNDSEDSHIFGCADPRRVTGKLVKVL